MSRLPQPSRNRTTLIKPPSTPTAKAGVSTAGTATPRVRTQSAARPTTPSRARPAPVEEPPMPKTALSIKEAIALKRAEAKKSSRSGASGGLDSMGSLEDALPTPTVAPEEEDLLGRLPLRDTIEKARGTGSLNLATRDLECLPKALFEMHLNIAPDPLKSAPNDPTLPPLETTGPSKRGGTTKWFEAQDLTVLKAGNNSIEEIQHEISLFGSLKTLDLHKNKIAALPATIADLSALTVLDLSRNALTSLPENIWSLPELSTLNVSHNKLTTLPFNAPFKSANGVRGNQYASTDFFTPAVCRAVTPLPHLLVLDASNNQITAAGVDSGLPVALTKVDLSNNPLGPSKTLLRSLSDLKRLKELRLEKADIGDDSFPPDAFSSNPFPALLLLDASETQASRPVVEAALHSVKQELDFEFSTADPPVGVLRVLVGKQLRKEPWELELERRARERVLATTSFTDDWTETLPPPRSTSRASQVMTPPLNAAPSPKSTPRKPVAREIIKEAWEIEAEQGLATEAGRRRAKVTAASIDASSPASLDEKQSPAQAVPPLENPKYYNAQTMTLTLPPSAAVKASHSRAFSVASTPFGTSVSEMGELSLPTPTLPLATIVTQTFANSLKVLILTNRRMDRSFSVPGSLATIGISGFLPVLEELNLEGCNLADTVPIHGSEEGGSAPPRSSEPILPTLAKLFPSLKRLNLSYNTLTDAALKTDALSELILSTPQKGGLRSLSLRGNKLSELEGFRGIAEMFRGNRDVPVWKLDELDVRDNDIGKLAPELGMLPLEVFLVDGNTFRVPQRRVWEREGTKGLLSWLRGRLE